ncbi:MAG: tRNA (N6-threonylcarbamoyladenosine(37)-N6)-methyltransferase TrmO [Dehalococcoidales bacterium]|nr:tRNA (N6-threonylcarbamoyladenosine(37)-N6)-methyltransferase TrmO [Dehalococcoidales bacterium]
MSATGYPGPGEETAYKAQDNTFIIKALGIIRNQVKEPSLKAGDSDITMQGDMDQVRSAIRDSGRTTSEIVISADMLDILDGIEEYSHIIVLYWAHKVPENSRLLKKVHPMGRKENPLVGIFCTCSPARPNPVLMSVVPLCGKKGNVLQVSGLDAIDGSPVIDIKPYVKEMFPQQEVRTPVWMRRICRETAH